jgi:hypothetical protein
VQSLPDINIICEKLAISGVTRFEDRFRLPLGISINMTSYAAKLLVLTMYDPERGIRLVAGFGRSIDLTVIDSSALCAEGARSAVDPDVRPGPRIECVLPSGHEAPCVCSDCKQGAHGQ